ncbi:unnamed protein product, partial [Owenia fusiformis]
GDMLFHIEKLITSLKEIKRFTRAHNIRRFIVFGGRHEAKFYSTGNGTIEIISGMDEEIIQRGQGTKLGRSDAQDYFITSKTSFPWDAVPDFVISLPAFDNWLLMFSNKADISTFDITTTNLAVHQAGVPKFEDSNYKQSASSNTNLWNESIISYLGNTLNCFTWRLGLWNGLRAGVLLVGALCRSGVRTKLGINMVTPGEPRVPRLSKEGRTGPGRKRSRQKSSCRAVVGSRL